MDDFDSSIATTLIADRGPLLPPLPIPKFIWWMKYTFFMYDGFKLLMKVQYSGDELYECESKGGCRSQQSSPSFDTVNLSGGLEEIQVLLATTLEQIGQSQICIQNSGNDCGSSEDGGSDHDDGETPLELNLQSDITNIGVEEFSLVDEVLAVVVVKSRRGLETERGQVVVAGAGGSG
ncbi:hypothetical protein Vadar_023003 [Vaccinium darrowii]|uniref:Uncharacterized protein n=1 Tax=Vaccinium darrowii TaxID=229202 RepID=A0ACB7Z6P0_9ERIC|nr:hypothetical protein Vadar_023003 [Vaccinium darrowii]